MSPIGKELLTICDNHVVLDSECLSDEELSYALSLGIWCFP